VQNYKLQIIEILLYFCIRTSFCSRWWGCCPTHSVLGTRSVRAVTSLQSLLSTGVS